MSAELSTPRLRLISLSKKQLQQVLTNLVELEKEFALPISSQIIDPTAVHAIKIKLDKMKSTSISCHDWLTYWLIISKDPPNGIGLVGFKGLPDENGEVEIGYGIDASFWNHGYMTEAAQALCDWAFSYPVCKAILAETISNPASDRVLEKLGFKIIKQDGKSNHWKIYKNQ